MRYSLKVATAFCALILGFNVYAQQEGELVIDTSLQEEIAQESGLGESNVIKESNVATPNQKVLIVNQNPQSQAVQQQPITNVEASPLIQSRAEQIARLRQEAEVANEQALKEKLETSRLEDERSRLNKLFKGADDSTQIAPAAPSVQVIPMVQQDNGNEDLKNEIIEGVRAELKASEVKTEVKKESKKRTYISGNVGIIEYEDAINIENEYAAGFSVGAIVDDNLIVEGSFSYSQFYIDRLYWDRGRPVYDELDQYNIGMAVKYAPLLGSFSPQVGALVNYTYRNYTERSYYNDGRYNRLNAESDTDAVDIGISAGLDIHVSDNFIIGGEYRYLWNFYNSSGPEFLRSHYSWNRGTPLEEFNYYTFAIVGKYLF